MCARSSRKRGHDEHMYYNNGNNSLFGFCNKIRESVTHDSSCVLPQCLINVVLKVDQFQTFIRQRLYGMTMMCVGIMNTVGVRLMFTTHACIQL